MVPKGYKDSPETILKKKASHKGYIPVGFKKNWANPHNKGKTNIELYGITEAERLSKINSIKHKGKIPTNLSDLHKHNIGLKHTDAFKKRLREINLGKKHSKETIEKLKQRIPVMLGKKHGAETKLKMSIAAKGKPKNYPPWNKGKINYNMMGEKNHAWKGGISKINKTIRSLFKYEEWRKEIFKRDNYECQNCGINCAYLNVHHIIEFNKLLKENNIKNAIDAINCNYLWDTNNGITLCNKCHKLKHRKLY